MKIEYCGGSVTIKHQFKVLQKKKKTEEETASS